MSDYLLATDARANMRIIALEAELRRVRKDPMRDARFWKREALDHYDMLRDERARHAFTQKLLDRQTDRTWRVSRATSEALRAFLDANPQHVALETLRVVLDELRRGGGLSLTLGVLIDEDGEQKEWAVPPERWLGVWAELLRRATDMMPDEAVRMFEEASDHDDPPDYRSML